MKNGFHHFSLFVMHYPLNKEDIHMITTPKQDKKTNFSYFMFYVSLLLMFTSGVSADFTRDHNTKIVTDNETGLQWQDNENASKQKWEDAIKYCEALILGSYDDWRLPNIRELESLVDDTKFNPSMSPVFQSVKSRFYWSSTIHGYRGLYDIYYDDAWLIDFSYGNQAQYSIHLKYMPRFKNNYNIRCVRGGE